MNDDQNHTAPPNDESRPGTPLVTEQVKASGSFQMPGDYYSQPPAVSPTGNRGCPRWIPIGCGLGGCLVLILMFVGVIAMSRGASSPRFSLWFVERMETELRGMMTPEVTPQQRAAFDREFNTLKSGIKNERVKFLQLGEWLELTRSVIEDRKVTPQEVESITASLQKLNSGGKSARAPAG